MINRNKKIMRFIAIAMCTSLLNNSVTLALEINTQISTNSSGENKLDNSTIVKDTSDSINVENLVSSTTEAAIIIGTNTSTSVDYVTIQQTDNGTIELDESSSDKTRGNFKYTIKPNDGYEIKDVIVDGQSVGVCTYYEFKNLTQSGHTISTVFKEIEKHATGYIPEFVEIPYVYKSDVNNNLPSEFGLDQATNSSSYNTTNKYYISPVKDQGQLGVCWTFSALGILESSLLKENNISTPAAATYDFSENHMRYALSSDGGNTLGFDRKNDDGGNFDMALAYLTRGKMNGAVNESDDPYPVNTISTTATAVRSLSEISNKTVQDYYPTQVIRLGNVPASATDIEKQARQDEIKNLITTYGSVTLSYFSDTNYYNRYNNNGVTTEAYYDPTVAVGNTNHAVCIVGWDDNYSVDNFKTGSKPTKPGAFLVKNNWGQVWGQNGYFYISYEDPNAFSGINAFKEIKNRGFFNNIYEYDTFGKAAMVGYGTHDAYYANVFNTKNSGLEKLSAISTYCIDPNSYIKLYVSIDGGQTFSEKTASSGYTYDTLKGYKIDDAGYYTFILDTPVELNSDKFVVAIEVQNQSASSITNIIPLEGSSASNAIVEKSSYIGSNLTSLKSKITSDINTNTNTKSYTGDTCIKAFTENITVDKTVLNNAIATANTNKDTAVASADGTDINPSNSWVTAAVMTAYTNAIATAQGVYDNASATQAQVDTAFSDLATATTTFNNAKQAGTKVTVADKTALQSLYNLNKDKIKGNFTTVTWTMFTTALNNANAVLAKANSTQSETDTAKNNLELAISGLAIIAVDKGGLQTLYDAHKSDIQGSYTTESWSIFTTELAKAKAVIDNTNATQLDVNAVLTYLNSAINGLIVKSSSSSGGSGGSGGSSGSSGSSSSSSNSESTSSSSSSTTITSSSSETTADTVKAIITSNGTAAATKDSIAKAIETIGLNNTVDKTVAKEIVKEVAKVVTENIVTNLKAVVGEGVIVSEAKEISTAGGNTIAVTTVTKDGKSEGAVITTSADSTTATIPVDTAAGEVTTVYKYVPLLGKYIQITDGVEITADAVTLPTQANAVYYATTTPVSSTEIVTQGWAKVDNNWYMVNKTGDVQTGWQKDSAGWVYLSSNSGVMQTGWNKQGETWYHLGSNGYMSTGWVKDNNTWYYLNSDGSMAQDTKIDGYYLSTNGAWVK